MKIDTQTHALPDRLDDHTVTVYYLPKFMGLVTAHPLLLDVRDIDGTLTHQLHLSPEDVATVVAAVAPKKTNTSPPAQSSPLTPHSDES